MVSPVAGTTRDAVDSVVEQRRHNLQVCGYRRHPPEGQDRAKGRESSVSSWRAAIWSKAMWLFCLSMEPRG